VIVGELLDALLRAALVVLADPAVRLEILEMLVGVSADVAFITRRCGGTLSSLRTWVIWSSRVGFEGYTEGRSGPPRPLASALVLARAEKEASDPGRRLRDARRT
jgi:hypothetical protein